MHVPIKYMRYTLYESPQTPRIPHTTHKKKTGWKRNSTYQVVAFNRLAGLLSWIKYRNLGIFYRMSYCVINNLFQTNKKKIRDKVHTKTQYLVYMGTGGSHHRTGHQIRNREAWAGWNFLFRMCACYPEFGTKSSEFLTFLQKSARLSCHSFSFCFIP